jgi:uncharacterized protein (DUF1330 family)
MTSSDSNHAGQTAPKGYWIVLAKVNDPSQFGNYTAMAGPLIASMGGRVLARGDVTAVVEGTIPGRPYVMNFQATRPRGPASIRTGLPSGHRFARRRCAEFNIVIVEGFVPSAATPVPAPASASR